MVYMFGDCDCMGLVIFGLFGGGVFIVGMMIKVWFGWGNVLNLIKFVG